MPFEVRPAGVASVSGGVQTVNDYYASNRATDDDPFEERTLGEENEEADPAGMPQPSELADEDDEFVEFDLADDRDAVAAADEAARRGCGRGDGGGVSVRR